MIPARYLGALEDERFDVLPAGPYRRSFLREYAEYLGLRGDIYADEYALRFEPPEPDPEPEPVRSSAARHLGRARDGITLRRAAVAVLLGVVVVAVWLLGTGGSGGRPVPAGTEAAAAARPAVHRAAPPPVRPVAPLAPPKRPPALTLAAARGDCWLAVRMGSSTGRSSTRACFASGKRRGSGFAGRSGSGSGLRGTSTRRSGGGPVTWACPRDRRCRGHRRRHRRGVKRSLLSTGGAGRTPGRRIRRLHTRQAFARSLEDLTLRCPWIGACTNERRWRAELASTRH